MYSQHAALRMQQRGISEQIVEHLLAFGRTSYHKGREVVYFDHQTLSRLQRVGEVSQQICQKLRRHYLVLQDGDVVTVGHRTVHFKRDRH